jgi:hypothetical protein
MSNGWTKSFAFHAVVLNHDSDSRENCGTGKMGPNYKFITEKCESE